LTCSEVQVFCKFNERSLAYALENMQNKKISEGLKKIFIFED